MISQLKSMFGLGPKIDFKLAMQNGAQIIDVRTKAEYPLNNLSNHYAKLDKSKTIITCCASGIRSAQAQNILQANGFKEVYNGGGWYGLQEKLK